MDSKTAKLLINPHKFDFVVRRLREFFHSKGFVEVHTQNRLSILAACEDPDTISTYQYAGDIWPLPQTGQMWLEYELLKHPETPGFFCLSTSYRNEKNPVEGRHDLIFPMFEFETHGGLDALVALAKELLEFLGYPKKDGVYPEMDYDDICVRYGTKMLEHAHEQALYNDEGPVTFIKNFPERTSPFWNMQLNEEGTHARKLDVILSGQETIGSAERSCNPDEMLHMFKTISDGDYAKTIYHHFGRYRVDAEMEEFLKLDFFPRCGGGIGVTRLIRSMEAEGLLKLDDAY